MQIPEAVKNSLSKWIKDTGPAGDVVITSRIRLARNLNDYPFPSRLSIKGRKEIVDKVDLAVNDESFDTDIHKMHAVRLEELPAVQRQIMVEKHLISPQHARSEDEGGRAVLLTDDETVAVMVNEEDHLRIQVLLPGLQLNEAWKTASQVDSALETKLTYAFNENLGYLTCCPTNVGTGLRASVMVHLPGLAMTQQLNKVLNALSKVGLAVRGLYGEGTEAVGNLFQISNQVTLGRSEEDIIKNLFSVMKKIMEQERSSREMLLEGGTGVRLKDRIWRAYGVLSNARIINSHEALSLLSDLRLGIDMEVVDHVDAKILNEMMVLIQPAFLQYIAGQEMSGDERDVFRADIIRQRVCRK